jgi:hypothetical protein
MREKHRWRNVESFAQLLDVGFVELSFLVQHFGYDAFRAKDGDQVFLAEIIGIHQRAKALTRCLVTTTSFDSGATAEWIALAEP